MTGTSDGIPSCRRYGAAGIGALEFGRIVTRQRHRVLTARKLHLEHHLPDVAERDLAAGQIELPHAAESLVVERARLVAVSEEAAAPLAPRLGVVQPQDLDVGGPQPAAP